MADDEVSPALEGLAEQLAKLPDQLADELSNWQTEDMKRRYPNIDRPDQNTATTEIWPRSRMPHQYVPTGKSRGRPAGSVNRAPLKLKGAPGQVSYSTRPILRDVLWDSLQERVDHELEDIKIG